jgi:hypothetical protein
MYNRLLEELKKKFAGVSDQILARVAKKLEPGVKSEDEVTAAVEGVTFQQLLESHGDWRATEATKTAVSNYEKKHNIKDGKPVAKDGDDGDDDGGADDGDDDGKMPKWAKALLTGYKAMEEKVNNMAGERVTANRRQQLDSVIASLPEALRKPYSHLALDNMEDEAFETMLHEVEAEVQGIQKEQKVKGAVFGRPTVNAGGSGSTGGATTETASKEEVEEAMKQIKIL